MELETKFFRLRTALTIGSRFDDWKVSWLGDWTRDRLSYLVMAARVRPKVEVPDLPTRSAQIVSPAGEPAWPSASSLAINGRSRLFELRHTRRCLTVAAGLAVGFDEARLLHPELVSRWRCQAPPLPSRGWDFPTAPGQSVPGGC
jgi:hypothetical protein